jgi:polar amino acid transport system permease protein
MDFITVTQSLLQGFGVTCVLFILTLVLAIPLGLAISFCTMSKVKVVKNTFKVIVWVIRGIPLMLQLFIVYYLPGMLSKTGQNLFGKLDNILYFNYGIEFGGSLIATLIAFVINYAAYFSEIFRGGIEAIPKGQYEAGQVLGLTKKQVFSKIILMQVVKHIIPPMSNEIITLVKDTALARVIGVIEIIKKADLFASKALVWPLFYAGAFYLVFVGVLTLLFGYIEKKLSYYKV